MARNNEQLYVEIAAAITTALHNDHLDHIRFVVVFWVNDRMEFSISNEEDMETTRVMLRQSADAIKTRAGELRLKFDDTVGNA